MEHVGKSDDMDEDYHIRFLLVTSVVFFFFYLSVIISDSSCSKMM